MASLQVLYEGWVQGVGFRWTVKRIATGYDVRGWVRNLSDGRVELRAEGEDDEVRAFLNGIRESELKAHIRRVEEHETPLLTDARGFEIRM
jgi:acylphosphatase